MLVLARHVNEEIVLDGDIVIKIVEIQGNQVRLGIDAPREVGVYRREVYDNLTHANEAAARARPELLGSVLKAVRKG